MDKTVKKMDKAAVKRGKYAVISDDDMAIIKRAVLEDRANSSDIVKKQLVDSKISPRTMRSIVAKIKRGVAVRAGAKRAPGGGRKFNPELVKKVQEMKNPDGETISSNVRAIARSLKAPYTQVRRICESHFKNVSKVKGARMSSKNQEDRANFSKEISAMMNKKKNPLKLEDLWFSDEKMFTSMPKNQGTRNDRVLIPKGKKKVRYPVEIYDPRLPVPLRPSDGWLVYKSPRPDSAVLPPEIYHY